MILVSKNTCNYFLPNNPIRLKTIKLLNHKSYIFLYSFMLFTNIILTTQIDFENLETKKNSFLNMNRTLFLVISVLYFLYFLLDKILKSLAYGLIQTKNSINSNLIYVLDNILILLTPIWINRVPSLAIFRILVLIKELSRIFKPIKIRIIGMVLKRSFVSLSVLIFSFAILILGIISIFNLIIVSI